MLTVVPDRRTEDRDLIFLVEFWRPVVPLLLELFLLPLVGLALVLSGLSWAWLLIGAATALALSRFGPHWWPGKR
jgi:hypothetical protein